MPLENGEWRETTPEDIKAFEESFDAIHEVPLSPELQSKLDAALAAPKVDPGPSLSVLVEGNRKLYPHIARMLSKSQGAVDIVVPVYNAWHITRKCLAAVLNRTDWPHRIWVVDDSSDEYTGQELQGSLDDFDLIRNEKNRGFAATVNRGIKAGTGEYVCLLNSDVIVTPGWLTKMVMALESHERNAIVCPATNNTAVVEVPMSPGASYLHMNAALEGFATRRYPEILPTGFCFLFRRSLLQEIGYFDEGFRDFGEETAWWWKCVKAGYRAVMADDTYVFHERASSYSALGAEKHGSYRRAASARFNQLYPEWTEWRDSHDVKRTLGPLRQAVPPSLLRSSSDRYRVCWLVHDARSTGAMRYIADIANELCERGVNAKIVVLKREHTPEEWIGELRSAPVFFASMEELLKEFPARVFPEGLVIASTVELAPAVQALVEGSRGRLRGCLHAQSFEPALALEEADKAHLAALYKLLPDVIASSGWVGEEIAALGPTPFAVIHPGVDRTLFYPRDRSKGDERPTVMIPMNPSVWWRGWDRGLELIQALEKAAGDLDLRILVYGVDSLPIVSRAICLGVLTQARLAHLLGTEVDAFVDPSHLHSYGMPIVEAMATNVTMRPFSWENRGIREVAESEEPPGECTGNDSVMARVFPDSSTPAEVAAEILEWLPKAHEINYNGACMDLFMRTYHDREKSVSAWIEAVEKHFKLLRKKLRICIVAPHLRKWGGPTTMLMIAHELARRGHRVEFATVYEDVHAGIAALAEVPIRKGQLPEGADLYITNSDNPWVEQISALRPASKAIMLKLSHNPRFRKEEERGLDQDWDAVVTSTEWLKDVCVVEPEGWMYQLRQLHDVNVIGWWHYEHARFRCPPSERMYGDGSAERPFLIGTLIHAHPTKGTREACEILLKLRDAHPKVHMRFVGVGEVPPRAVRLPEGFDYVYEPTRDQMASVMKTLDAWLSCSQTEGLGRIYLEAMSAGCGVVASKEAAIRGIKILNDREYKPDALSTFTSWPKGWREANFEYAERAADPEPCINALEEVISGIAK